MTEINFDSSLCSICGQPLFLSKEECRKFIEKRLKEGYMVCRCCGAKQKTEIEGVHAKKGKKTQPA